jgi:branched-chain amino acid transport system permease protein
MIAQQLANSLALGGAYALMALGYSLIFGVLRLIHFSYGDIMVMGGYIALTLVSGLSHSFGLILTSVVVSTTLVGVLVERVSFRPLRNAPYMVSLIASLGMSLMIANAVLLLWGPARKLFAVDMPVATLTMGGIQLSGSRVLAILVCVGVMVALDFLLRRTRFGMAIRATILDRDAAILMGINREFVIVSTFIVGSALSGIAMLILGSMYGVIFPTEGAVIGTKVFAAAIIGGLGSIPGAVVGGLLMGFVETLSAAYISVVYKDAIAMALLVLVLIVRPDGILGKRGEENI